MTTTHEPSTSRLHKLPVPDLRFEYSYLKSIGKYVHRSTAPEQTIDEKAQAEDHSSLEPQREATAEDVYSIEWGWVSYITVRDQVIMPFVQGLVWGVASFYLRPLISTFMAGIRATKSDSPSSPRRINSGGINKLRSWANGTLGGLQPKSAFSR